VTDAYEDFRTAVNMTAGELEKWLKTEESQQVGQKKSEGAESVGHDSGRKIIKILHTKKGDLTSADEDHMRKVTGYVHRHLAQRPSGDIKESKWRYSLMNWGHDPLKK
jgi:DNA topoisomerase VI subunit B